MLTNNHQWQGLNDSISLLGDNVPCEIDNRLYYLIEVTENEVVFKQYKKQSTPFLNTPTSIRIL